MGYDGPNYTQTPNLFLDEHLPEMGCAETKVVLAVIRQTFGWHKEKDRLSISQLMELTGLSNRAVIDGTQQAIERGVIDRQKSGNSYEYWLVVDGEDTSQARDQGVNNAHTPCEDTSQEGVNEAHTQKKGKETSQKKRDAPAHGDESASFSELVATWRDIDATPYLSQRHENTFQKWANEGVIKDLNTFREVLEADAKEVRDKDCGFSLRVTRENYEEETSVLSAKRQDDPDWSVIDGEPAFKGVPISQMGPQNVYEQKDGSARQEPEVSVS